MLDVLPPHTYTTSAYFHLEVEYILLWSGAWGEGWRLEKHELVKIKLKTLLSLKLLENAF